MQLSVNVIKGNESKILKLSESELLKRVRNPKLRDVILVDAYRKKNKQTYEV